VDGARISFLEAKPIDWTQIRALLAESDRLNHWANFGPVAQRLESTLEDLLGLSPSKAVVATSSGTAALFASAGIFAARLRHPPRWVKSAFGFVSTRAGPFANTQFVDCDGRGFLSLDALADVPSDTYDAVLVTNVFAAQARFTPYADFCRANGKALLVDNAMALFGVDRASNCVPEEIVSLHHTKPWGFGEGGFAIVSRDDAPLIRNLLWCGKEASHHLSAFGGNGKLSETAAAFILNRLEKRELWAPAYREQWSRIAEIGQRLGLKLLSKPADSAVTGFVPLLAPRPVSREQAHASSLPIMKYYPPLADLPKASELYNHILCLACHPGMVTVGDDVIERELAGLIAQPTA
jgi:dTDP-4-amino-4,6-dideoxygalactose transaminase